MVRVKPRVKYHSISLPVPFIEEIKKHILEKPEYRSIADFAREALREKMHNNSLKKRVERLELIVKNLE